MVYIALLFIIVMVFFYYNTFVWLINSWINNPYYSHGFLVPFISGYLIWNIRKELALAEKKQTMTGLALIIIGILIHILSTLSTMRFLSGISLILSIAGVIIFLFGEQVFKKILFPIIFLFFMIPLPFTDVLAPPIQTISATLSSALANFIGIPVTREGLILHIPNATFEVGLECSGLRSIITLITIAVIFAFMLEGGLLMKSIILLSSIPLAILGNIFRIISMLTIADLYGKDIAMRYFHDFSSIFLFAVVLVSLFSIGRCFGRLKFKKTF